MQLASSALYPVTGPSNRIRKSTHHTRYACYHLHLLNPLIKDPLRNALLSSHAPPLRWIGSGFSSWVRFDIFILRDNIRATVGMAKSLTGIHSIFRTYEALVLCTVITIPNIMVCSIHPTRRVSVPASQPFSGMSIVCFFLSWPISNTNFVSFSALA